MGEDSDTVQSREVEMAVQVESADCLGLYKLELLARSFIDTIETTHKFFFFFFFYSPSVLDYLVEYSYYALLRTAEYELSSGQTLDARAEPRLAETMINQIFRSTSKLHSSDIFTFGAPRHKSSIFSFKFLLHQAGPALISQSMR